MRHATIVEVALRRDGLIFVGGLTLVCVSAWVWLLLGAGMDMSAVEMTDMAGMDGWLMRPAEWSLAYATLMFSMWWIMMIAMMLPSAAPMLLTVIHMMRKQARTGSSVVHAGAFASGYLVMWGLFSFVATALQWLLEHAALMSPMLEITNVWLGAGILIAAGAWQFTPMKAKCLHHCRNPMVYLIAKWRSGRWGAFRMGLGHGAYCLGCCWFLMALLFFGGVMNLYWIVALTVFVILEKTIPLGHWLGKASGASLVACGLVVLYAPV
jgi:predicted metal-binding membrane protein